MKAPMSFLAERMLRNPEVAMLALELHRRGVEAVLITDGEEGPVVGIHYGTNKFYSFENNTYVLIKGK